jgi:hypothetical protein
VATVLILYIQDGVHPSQSMVISTTLMVLGAFIAGYENLESDGLGFLIVWGCNFAQAGANCTISRFNKDKRLSTFEITYFFYLAGFFTVCPYVYFSGTADSVIALLSGDQAYNFALFFAPSTVSGILITVLTNMCVALGGAIAVNITGTLRDVGLTYLGFLLFDDITPTGAVLIGIGISFLGAMNYVYD